VSDVVTTSFFVSTDLRKSHHLPALNRNDKASLRRCIAVPHTILARSRRFFDRRQNLTVEERMRIAKIVRVPLVEHAVDQQRSPLRISRAETAQGYLWWCHNKERGSMHDLRTEASLSPGAGSGASSPQKAEAKRINIQKQNTCIKAKHDASCSQPTSRPGS